METQTLLKGNVQKELIYLALPLLFSNILQQFYNTADSLIIGQFLGGNAFASTGISGTLMNLFIFVLNGFCVGISVIFAQSYGVGDKKAFRRKLFLAFTMGLLLSVFFGIAATLSLNTLLSLIQTPDVLMNYCRIYMTIILIGLPAIFLYNFFAAILRSVGNTRAALCFLLISVAANLIFDYLLIAILKTGISGAAYATVISQLLSALCCLVYLKKKYGEYICTKSDMGFELPLFLQILQFGFVSALHQSSLYIGKILVQGAVNTLGTEGIAAYTATMRIEGIANSFGDSGSQSLSIFTSQNNGAGNRDRVQKGLKTGFFLLVLLGLTISVIMYFSSTACLSVFLEKGEGSAISYGTSYLKSISVFYVLCFIGNVFVGYFRGIGRVMIPFIGTTSHLTLRVILTWLLISRLGLSAVAIVTGGGWILVVVYQLIMYRKAKT